MYNFFVLGQIPGTSIVITFVMWIELCALMSVLAFWALYVRKRPATKHTIILEPTISAEATA